MKWFNIIYGIILAGCFVAVNNCSTEKNTFIRRNYHNLTAHYNAYYNGRESFKEGVRSVDRAFTDNYSMIIPVFKYGDPSLAGSITSQMDRAQKKASKVIKRHSIKVKPKRKKNMSDKQREFYKKPEFCKWIDDSWLLLGKARFYIHNFTQAEQAFNYIIKTYTKEPVRFNAMLWLARSYNETGRFDKAKAMLDKLESTKELKRKLKCEIAATYADYYIKQEDYISAIPKLEKAIEYKPKRKKRVRYLFIMAQIHQYSGNNVKASELYSKVIRMNPPYDMAFSAKIRKAMSFQAGKEDSKEIRKILNKMLKDDKNIEYQDQIYYALGNIAMKEGLTGQAVSYYKRSVGTSTVNTNQKAISYLELAKIYFNMPKYDSAQAYYDSSLTLLSTDYPNYEQIAAKAGILTELIHNLQTVTREDSLQMVAQMDSLQRLKFIDNLIAKVREEEARQQELERQRMMNMMNNNNNNNKGKTKQSGQKWYFYNPTTLQLGIAEFKRKWGERPLEDNWRRKNKEIMSFEIEEEETDSADVEERVTDNKTREYYIQDLPLTDSAMKASHEQIKTALYEAGNIYKNELGEFQNAITQYEELNKRYPGNVYELQALYYLYSLNKLMEKQERADFYKNQIIQKYPGSKYAKILQDPDYLRKLQEAERKLFTIYENSYNDYISGKYFNIIHNYNYVDTAYTDNELMPKFTMLKAMALGKQGEIDASKETLKELTEKYPDSEVKPRAEYLLAYLEEGGYITLEEADSSAAPEEEPLVVDSNEIKIYTHNEDTAHIYMIIANDRRIEMNRLKFEVLSYNIDNFPMREFETVVVPFDKDHKLLLVKDFKTAKTAGDYSKQIQENEKIFGEYDPSEYRQFIISTPNFEVFLKDKDIQKYLGFFSTMYFKQPE